MGIAAAIDDRRILGLVAVIIGNGGVAQIDTHKLRRNGASATGLTDTEDHIGAKGLGCGVYGFCGCAKNHGDTELCQCISTNFRRQLAEGIPGGVCGFASEGFKTGDQ